ncbi:hypothetical protein BESB_006820 [Besnoitia besnoiti]|uniref:Proteasome assembly chaperone 4 n=1 Tax=Besnoitia besnoiti TaxID=94643 RepID=A0A2A9MP04_BESBE|nr:hypothetical protein BESB_006820 [Besnoitia besnoiti]PFH38341.1 hypothetical protein BESB_006820 [Besnoitia besnoiti]
MESVESCTPESQSALETGALGGLLSFSPDTAGVVGKIILVAKCGTFAIYRLRCTYMRTLVLRFLFILMENAMWIWVGDQKEVFEDLEAAFPVTFSGATGNKAVSTCLFSSDVDSSSSILASKLATRLERPVFLSVNVDKADGQMIMFIQKVLQEQSGLLLRPDVKRENAAD